MKRNVTLDILKGTCIIIVVMNHVFVRITPKLITSILSYNVTWSFDMGVFFVVAGYLSYRSLNKSLNSNKWLMNKAYYLLTPHFVFNFLIYFASIAGIAEWENLSTNFTYGQWLFRATFLDAGDWFLWILFLSFAVLYGFSKLKDSMGSNYLFGIIAITVMFMAVPFSSEILRLYRLQYYFPLVLGGYLFAQYQDKLVKILTLRNLTIATVPLLGLYILVMHWSGWNGGWGSLAITNLFSNPKMVLLRYAQFITILPAVYLICYGLGKVRGISKALAWLGGITLGVYLVTLTFTNVGFGDGWVRIASSVLISLSIGVVVTVLLKQFVFKKVNRYVVGVR